MKNTIGDAIINDVKLKYRNVATFKVMEQEQLEIKREKKNSFSY